MRHQMVCELVLNVLYFPAVKQAHEFRQDRLGSIFREQNNYLEVR